MTNGQPAEKKELPTLLSLLMVFGSFLVMFTAWFTYGAFGFYKAAVSKSWPTAAGIVVAAPEVSKSGKQTRYGIDILYSYTVGGQGYQSNYFKETPQRGTPERAQVISQYAPDSRVAVYYNPKDPEDSVIEPGLRKDNYFMVLVPLFAIVAILIALVDQIRNKKYRTDNPDGMIANTTKGGK